MMFTWLFGYAPENILSINKRIDTLSSYTTTNIDLPVLCLPIISIYVSVTLAGGHILYTTYPSQPLYVS